MHIEELSGVKLTPEQLETVKVAALFMPLRLRAELTGLGDRLRPIRDIKSIDVNHNIAACLNRYAPKCGTYRGKSQRCGWVRFWRSVTRLWPYATARYDRATWRSFRSAIRMPARGSACMSEQE